MVLLCRRPAPAGYPGLDAELLADWVSARAGTPPIFALLVIVLALAVCWRIGHPGLHGRPAAVGRDGAPLHAFRRRARGDRRPGLSRVHDELRHRRHPVIPLNRSVEYAAKLIAPWGFPTTSLLRSTGARIILTG